MPEQTEWETKAANTLKAALKLRGVTYAELAKRIGEKEVNIRNKLSRGKFSAAFLFQSLCAIDVARLEIENEARN
jgi:transcriptional regulator with XRE-family HTH domain